MLSRNGSKRAALRRLVLAAVAIAAVALVVWALDWGRKAAALRERAYPVPESHCANDTECAEKALQVQAREAATAEAALEVAVFQFALSLAGVFGVGFTIFYAHRAWKEAERSADAAHETLEDARADAAAQAKRFADQLSVAAAAADAAARQVEIAEDTARKQLRAYVYAEVVHISWESEGHPRFEITLRNSGATPALNVWCGSAAEIGAVSYYPAPPEDLKMAREPLIGATTTRTLYLACMGSVEIRQSGLGKDRMLYVTGKVRYDDVFGVTLETEFCFWAASPDPPDGRMTSNVGHRPSFREVRPPG